MGQEQFITDLSGLRDLLSALSEDEGRLWKAIYSGNDGETGSDLEALQDRATTIARVAGAMREGLKTLPK